MTMKVNSRPFISATCSVELMPSPPAFAYASLISRRRASAAECFGSVAALPNDADIAGECEAISADAQDGAPRPLISLSKVAAPYASAADIDYI